MSPTTVTPAWVRNVVIMLIVLLDAPVVTGMLVYLGIGRHQPVDPLGVYWES